MHDICLSKAKEEEFFNVIVIEPRENQLVPNSSSVLIRDIKPRRLIIYLDDKGEGDGVAVEPILNSIDWPIRCLLVMNNLQGEQWVVESSRSTRIEYPLSLGMFTLLRVLELQRINFPKGKLPRGLKRLVHLRYLKFSFCTLNELPSYIGNFVYLQVLDVQRQSEPLLIVPNVLWKLRQLMYLGLPRKLLIKKDQKLRLDGLSKLEMLINISSSMCNVKDVAKLANLQIIEFEVKGNSGFEDMVWFINHVSTRQMVQVKLGFEDCDFRSKEGRSLLSLVFQCPVRLYWLVVKCKFPELRFDPPQLFLLS